MYYYVPTNNNKNKILGATAPESYNEIKWLPLAYMVVQGTM